MLDVTAAESESEVGSQTGPVCGCKGAAVWHVRDLGTTARGCRQECGYAGRFRVLWGSRQAG